MGKKKKEMFWDFSDGPVVKNPPSNVRDAGSIPGQGMVIPTCLRATLQLLLSPDTSRKIQCSQSKKINKNKILQKKEMFLHAREAVISLQLIKIIG